MVVLGGGHRLKSYKSEGSKLCFAKKAGSFVRILCDGGQSSIVLNPRQIRCSEAGFARKKIAKEFSLSASLI